MIEGECVESNVSEEVMAKADLGVECENVLAIKQQRVPHIIL